MIKWLLLSYIVLGLFLFEAYRLQSVYSECAERRELHGALLKSDTCNEDYLRRGLPEVVTLCTKAKKEQEDGVYACTVRQWWAHGEMRALYARVFESQLMLYAIIMPTVLLCVYMYFAGRAEQRREERMHRERLEMIQQIQQSQHQTVPRLTPVPTTLYKGGRLTNRERRLIKQYHH